MVYSEQDPEKPEQKDTLHPKLRAFFVVFRQALLLIVKWIEREVINPN